jgi:hypothetical protein
MHFSRRRIIVALCFAVWIGAAGVICRALVTQPLEGDEAEIRLSSPALVVHAEPVVAPARVEVAQR